MSTLPVARRAPRRLSRWTVLLASLAALVLVAVVWFVPILLHLPLSASDLRGVAPADRIQLQQEQSRLQEEARLHLLQALGGLLLLAGAVATWQGVQVSREGQITDRFTSATEQLGSDKLDVRIGGVHALERIAVNSADDRLTIMEILMAFIRGHAPYPAGSPTNPDPHPTPAPDINVPYLRDRGFADVQVAVTVLGRQGTTLDVQMELSMVDLRRAYLTRAQLRQARIRRSNLAGAVMRQIHLERGDLKETDLRHAILSEAHLNGARLESAYLDAARLPGAQMQSTRLLDASLRSADLHNADLHNADLRGADLRDARLDGANLTGCRWDHRTRWPPEYDDPALLLERGARPPTQPRPTESEPSSSEPRPAAAEPQPAQSNSQPALADAVTTAAEPQPTQADAPPQAADSSRPDPGSSPVGA